MKTAKKSRIPGFIILLVVLCVALTGVVCAGSAPQFKILLDGVTLAQSAENANALTFSYRGGALEAGEMYFLAMLDTDLYTDGGEITADMILYPTQVTATSDGDLVVLTPEDDIFPRVMKNSVIVLSGKINGTAQMMTVAEITTPTRGDADRDGDIDADDALAVLRHALKSEILTEPDALVAADFSGDGVVNMEDVIGIMRYALTTPTV